MAAKLVSVVIPVYNTPKEFLEEALDSIAGQTLEKRYLQIIVVNDASTSTATLDFLSEISASPQYKGIDISLVRHETNKWLAQSRIRGSIEANTEFLLFLDSDDSIRSDFIKKSLLLLQTNPNAGWVYTTKSKFGSRESTSFPAPFNVWQFFILNKSAYASLMRAKAWREVLQREVIVIDNLRFFEDWDTYIRLMGKQWYGLPLGDTVFFYRQNLQSLISRSVREYAASIYLTWRLNLWSLLKLPLTHIRFRRSIRRGWVRTSWLNPMTYINYIGSKTISGLFGFNNLPIAITSGQLFKAIFLPRQFVDSILSTVETQNLAELKSGFRGKPDVQSLQKMSYYEKFTERDQSVRSVLVFHTWWATGGAENVLLNWIKSIKEKSVDRIIDVAQLKDDSIRTAFAEYVDEQYSISDVGETPLDRLRFCWNLICYERPNLIIISANSDAYMLVPLIKQKFPEAAIVDILHNEYEENVDWFSVANEYSHWIDKRAVVSNHWKSVLTDRYHEASNKVSVLHNMVDTDVFNPDLFDGAAERELLNIPKGAVVLGFVGRLTDQKNPDVFLELSFLLATNPRYFFLIAGCGELEGELAEKLAASSNVVMLGRSDDVPRVLSIIDILICPSRFEGFPLIGLEAAAMNVSVIAADVAGFREQIQNGKFGRLYTATQDSRIDAKIVGDLILSGEENILADGLNGRGYVTANHSAKLLKDQYVVFTRSLLDKSSDCEKQVILHIGAQKTASSFLQRFMNNNRSLLQEQSILYPHDTSGIAHHAFLFNFFDGFRFHNDPPLSRSTMEYNLKHVQSQIRHSDAKTIVLSSESLSNAAKSNAEFKFDELVEFLNTCGVRTENISVLYFIRRPDEWVESRFNQRIKSGSVDLSTTSIAEFVAQVGDELSGVAPLKYWGGRLGSRMIKVIPFEKCQFENGIEKRFLTEIGGRWDQRFQVPDLENTRLSRDCLAYISQIAVKTNQRGKLRTSVQWQRLYAVTRELESYTLQNSNRKDSNYWLSPEERRMLIVKYEQIHQEIAHEYLGLPKGKSPFRDPWPRLDEPWEPYSGPDSGEKSRIEEYLSKNVRLGLLPVAQRLVKTTREASHRFLSIVGK